MSSSTTALLFIVYFVLIVFEIAAVWRVFTKAGQPGWAAIIPIYNVVVFMRIAQRPAWWTILTFIPVINIIMLDIARFFGRSSGFAIGMVFLSFIFFPILGFGSAVYQGSSIGPSGVRIQPAI